KGTSHTAFFQWPIDQPLEMAGDASRKSGRHQDLSWRYRLGDASRLRDRKSPPVVFGDDSAGNDAARSRRSGTTCTRFLGRPAIGAPVETVNLKEKFSRFTEHFSPKVIGEVNDCQVKAVKLKGEFVWHHHDVEDELFLVVKG